jgi:hypothetical protein
MLYNLSSLWYFVIAAQIGYDTLPISLFPHMLSPSALQIPSSQKGSTARWLQLWRQGSLGSNTILYFQQVT